MGLGDLLRRGPKPGTVWEGAHEYVDPDEAALRGIVPGHYAVTGRGRLIRCVAVDDAPGDPGDGSWHLEIAGKGDPIAKQGRPVILRVEHVHGKARVTP